MTDLSVLEPYLAELWSRNGTDLHFTVGAPPLARIDGALVPLWPDAAKLDEDDVTYLVAAALGEARMGKYAKRKELDLSFNWGTKGRFRGNAYHQRSFPALSLRLIPTRIPSFQELGLPTVLETLSSLPQGLILFTGPTGSGKSTTQASMIDWINSNRRCHVLTIEDPIEYIHPHRSSAVDQREIGSDSDSFANALRAALREDPDVVLVGEMRDTESIQTTLTIAETGHLVLATLHTNDAAQTLDRIVDVFPSERQSQIRVQLAGSLAAVVSQRLLPRIGGGQVAAFEILVATHAVRNLVKEGKTRQLRNVIVTGQQENMQTLEMSLTELVKQGLVDYDEAIGHTLYPNEVHRPALDLDAVALAGR